MFGFIGGSGFYEIEGFSLLEEKHINTPFGEPSSSIKIGKIKDKVFAFLSRHGDDHSIPPHLINYRANIYALKELGVKALISFGAVGGINLLFEPGDYVITSDIIDLTKNRESTFYEGKFSKIDNKEVFHVDMSSLFNDNLRAHIFNILKSLNLRFHTKGVYAATEGPRFETPAEINMLKILGADMVGMTAVPEVTLAREIGMCVAHISIITNLAAGIEGKKLTSKEVIQMMKEKALEIKKIVEKILEIEEKFNCEDILKDASVK